MGEKIHIEKKESKVTLVTAIISFAILSLISILFLANNINNAIVTNAISPSKGKTLSSSLHHNDGTNIEKSQDLQFSGSEEESAIGTKSSNFASVKNDSPEALAIAHHLYSTSINASNTQAKLGTPCMPELTNFIKPQKESRFTIVKPCVTVTGKVSWIHYFNDDGDANFNVVLDSPYKDMLGPGNYGQAFSIKYGVPALHVEVVCQGPVTSISPENVGACNGYKDPNFKHVLPKIGDHVMVTGRYLVEMPEMPGGITELHPAYDIKVLH